MLVVKKYCLLGTYCLDILFLNQSDWTSFIVVSRLRLNLIVLIFDFGEESHQYWVMWFGISWCLIASILWGYCCCLYWWGNGLLVCMLLGILDRVHNPLEVIFADFTIVVAFCFEWSACRSYFDCKLMSIRFGKQGCLVCKLL